MIVNVESGFSGIPSCY